MTDNVDNYNFYSIHATLRFGPGSEQIDRYNAFLNRLSNEVPIEEPDEKEFPDDLLVLYPIPSREEDSERMKADWMNRNWGCTQIQMSGMSKHPRPGVVDMFFHSDGRCIQFFEQLVMDFQAEVEYKLSSFRDDVHGVVWITPTKCFRIEENAKRTSRLTHEWRNSFWREPRYMSHQITAELREQLLEMVDASGVPKIFGVPEPELETENG